MSAMSALDIDLQAPPPDPTIRYSGPVELSRRLFGGGHYPGNGLVVADAADELHAKLSDAQYLASFAPPPIYYARCTCGSVFEVRATEVTAGDREAIADWDLAHSYCGDDL